VPVVTRRGATLRVKRDNTLRFGVRRGEYRAASWFAYTNSMMGSTDAYVSCRELSGALHFSMHETGAWHVAFEAGKLSELFDPVPKGKDRFIVQWQRPEPRRDGSVIACRIISPAMAVTAHDPRIDARVHWITAPPPGHAVFSYVVLRSGPRELSCWPGMDEGMQLVGALEMAGDRVLYVMHRVQEFTTPAPQTAIAPQYFRGASEADLLVPLADDLQCR